MPRSASDATRFTATGPYASSSGSFTTTAPSGSTINLNAFAGPAPPGETAQQKIARLRAAALAARRGKESNFDVAVRVGRIWADRLHRTFAVGLIGFTVVAGCLATAGITDMLLHNRRRRNEWLAEQQAKSARDLAEARMAEAAGTATEDQMLLINRARAEMEAKQRKGPGVVDRVKNWARGAKEDEATVADALPSESKAPLAAAVSGQAENLTGQRHDRSTLQAVQQEVESHRRQGEKIEEVVRPTGGPLDQEAQRALEAATKSGKTWVSWLTGR